MTACQVREIAKLKQRIAALEAELDHKANVISDLADELAKARHGH